MSERVERVTSVVLTACAVLFTGILVKREFFEPARGAAAGVESAPPERVANWNELLANGVTVRSPKAPVVVVEFADLECPACKQFHNRLKTAANDLHADVGLVLVHFPLSTHRFSRQVARALECATTLGAAAPFVDVAYAKQDSFGLKPWVAYAQEAGIRDTVAFGGCVRDTARVARVEQGRKLGESMDIHGTPLVLINGWRFANVPTEMQLRGAIKALLQGQAPPGARAARGT